MSTGPLALRMIIATHDRGEAVERLLRALTPADERLAVGAIVTIGGGMSVAVA